MTLTREAAAAVPMLGVEEEARLIAAWQRDRDAAARERLVAAYMRLCYAVAARYARNEDHVGDLAQCGVFGLMRALDMFDPARGTRFSTYCRRWVQNFVSNGAGSVATVVSLPPRVFIDARMGRVPAGRGDPALAAAAGYVALDMPLSGEAGATPGDMLACGDPRPDELVAEASSAGLRAAVLGRAMLSLKEREREVVRRRRLSETPERLEDIARDLGVTRERVRQIEVAALARMRDAMARDGHGRSILDA